LLATYGGRKQIRDLLLAAGIELQLHEAAAAGDLTRVRELVNGSAELAKSYSPDGFPVLALAAAFGHLPVAQYLLEQGGDLNAAATNGTGYNALTGAVASNHTEVVAWLLENGADANYRYANGHSPLLEAAANGNMKILELLLKHGADVHAQTNSGKTALQFAEEKKHPEAAEFLRSRAAR
jgi:uncharacterized protein